MGLDNREYMRDEETRSGWGPGRRDFDVVMALIVANVCVFVLQQLAPPISDWLQLDPQLVLVGQIWRLTTYDFLHDPNGLMHIFVNMFVLWMTGTRLQARMGWQEFLAFYLVAGIFSGVGYVLWCAVSGHWNPCIGASGAVAGAIVLYAFYWPEQRWYLYGIVPISSMWLAIIYAAFDFYPLALDMAGRGGGDNVAHAAHLAGMAFAVLYAVFQWRLMSLLPASLFRRRPRLQVYDDSDLYETPTPQPPRPSVGLTAAEKRRLDDLLDKINLNGEASLTDEERRFMHEASRKLRAR